MLLISYFFIWNGKVINNLVQSCVGGRSVGCVKTLDFCSPELVIRWGCAGCQPPELCLKNPPPLSRGSEISECGENPTASIIKIYDLWKYYRPMERIFNSLVLKIWF